MVAMIQKKRLVCNRFRNVAFKRIFLAIFCASLLYQGSAWADTLLPQYSYGVTSANNRYIFVMLAPDPNVDETILPQELRTEARRLREKYRESGLYPNDGSVIPIWIVSWYANRVFLSSDSKHLVRQGPWASMSSDEALTFFADGKVLHSYQVRDLVDFTWFLPHSVSHFTWVKTIELDDARRTLELVTQYDDRYRFDLETGNMVYSRRTSRVVVCGSLLAIPLLVFLSAMLLKRRAQRRESASVIP